MLPVIIFEPDQTTRAHLCQCVNDYIRTRETKLRVVDNTAALKDVIRYVEQEPGISLMMLSLVADQRDIRRGVVQAGRNALKSNRDHYLMFCLHNAADIEALLSTGIRPAGILFSPFDKAKLEKLLTQIEKDYEEICEQQTGKCLVVDSGNSTYRVPFSHILYIEALDKKLNIWTERQSISVRMTLNNLEDVLPPDLFFRCHRSFLVNIHRIDHVDYSTMEIFLTTGESLPLSRTYRDKMRSILEQERDEGVGA